MHRFLQLEPSWFVRGQTTSFAGSVAWKAATIALGREGMLGPAKQQRSNDENPSGRYSTSRVQVYGLQLEGEVLIKLSEVSVDATLKR